MTRLLTALLLTAAAIAPAHATQATWKNMPNWWVLGDAEVPYCGAVSYFPSLDKAIHITLNTEGWAISVQGVNVVPGNKYFSTIGTNKNYGTFTGIAINEKMVKFSVSFNDVKKIAYAPFLTIKDVGKFSMKGSMEAIIETAVCFKALTDVKASVSVPSVAYEREI